MSPSLPLAGSFGAGGPKSKHYYRPLPFLPKQRNKRKKKRNSEDSGFCLIPPKGSFRVAQRWPKPPGTHPLIRKVPSARYKVSPRALPPLLSPRLGHSPSQVPVPPGEFKGVPLAGAIPGHSPRQTGGDAEQVHNVAGVAILAKDHLQNRSRRP